MMICVKYNDGKHGMVKPDAINQLIQRKQIKSFLRTGYGWVDIHVDSVRGEGGEYQGPDRRESYG